MESPFIWYRDGKGTPMVPCDDAAIDRAVEAVKAERRAMRGDVSIEEMIETAFRAAGETP